MGGTRRPSRRPLLPSQGAISSVATVVPAMAAANHDRGWAQHGLASVLARAPPPPRGLTVLTSARVQRGYATPSPGHRPLLSLQRAISSAATVAAAMAVASRGWAPRPPADGLTAVSPVSRARYPTLHPPHPPPSLNCGRVVCPLFAAI